MSRYRRFYFPLALLLPLVGLGLIWVLTERESHRGAEWYVPVAGYDPRDLLRGHYVQFRYDWPGVQADEITTGYEGQKILCIKGAAPAIESVEVLDMVGTDQSLASICDSTAKANPRSEEGNNGLLRDRIYVPQEAARDYEKKLANPELQGIVRIRINSSGFITPLSLSFQQRPEASIEQDEAG